MSFNCKKCGKTEHNNFMKSTAQRLESEKLCFSCDFWKTVAEDYTQFMERGKVTRVNQPDPMLKRLRAILVTPEYAVYYAFSGERFHGFLGHGGRLFLLEMYDGKKLTSDNVWHRGVVPEIYRDIIKPNGVMVEV